MVDKSTDHENEVKVVGNLFFAFSRVQFSKKLER